MLNRVSHVISGPVSFVARGSEPRRSVVTESLVPVSSAVTGEGESDANNVEDDTSDSDDVQTDGCTSDGDEEVLPGHGDLQATQPDETDSGCCRRRRRPIRYCDWV